MHVFIKRFEIVIEKREEKIQDLAPIDFNRIQVICLGFADFISSVHRFCRVHLSLWNTKQKITLI